MDKKSLRIWAKEQRKRFDMNAFGKKAVLKIQKLEEYKKAKNVMLFYPLEKELDLMDLTFDSSKNFYLPKINGNNLLCCSYKKDDELKLSKFKTQEPLTQEVDKNILDLVIVPALAVDKNNYRLGYGGGFYDRFLTNIKSTKIVILPKIFCVETINPEKYDLPMDKILLI